MDNTQFALEYNQGDPVAGGVVPLDKTRVCDCWNTVKLNRYGFGEFYLVSVVFQ